MSDAFSGQTDLTNPDPAARRLDRILVR